MTDVAVLVSGEGVAYDLQHAGLGSRVVAAVIDGVIQLGCLVILLAITGLAGIHADVATVRAISIIEVVLVIAGYPIVTEWLSRGRTVGKMCLGLRVLRDDGGPIGFRHALVRGLAGLVMEKPGLLAPLSTAAGCATMMCSSREKRIGDMMAGTFVLNERAGPQHSALARTFFVPYELQPWAMSLDLNRLDDSLALGVRQFVLRAQQMKVGAQLALGHEVRTRVLAVTAPPPPPGVPTSVLLMTVLAERRRRAEQLLAAAGQPARPAGYPSGWRPAPGQKPTVAPRTTRPAGPFAPPS